ncbi:MAG: FmdB family zinc ribbon protein [Planctomycetota bacterium]|jgi:putative FmdB family regulatory protein
MPTYDYQCKACGHAFEHFQVMSARKLRKCPDCGKSSLVRLVGAGAGVIFRGSGFYETDYKRQGSPKEGGAESTGSTKEPSTGGAKGADGASKNEGSTPSKGGSERA